MNESNLLSYLISFFREIKILEYFSIAVFLAVSILLIYYIIQLLKQRKQLRADVEEMRDQVNRLLKKQKREIISKRINLREDIKKRFLKIERLLKKKEPIEPELKAIDREYGRDFEYLFEYTKFCLKHKRSSACEDFLLQKRSKFRNDYRYFNLLGYFYNNIGKYKLALRVLQRAIYLKKDPKNYLNLGYAYWRLNKLEKAINITEEALDLNPTRETECNLKSNLAYYYAQANIVKNKTIALKYAQFAQKQYKRYKITNWLVNYGYVRIKFATDLEELYKAILYLESIENIREIKGEVKQYKEMAYDKIKSLLE